jgi:hypothetical protein
METIQISHDIDVFYVVAKSFPSGILEAFDALRQMTPGSEVRTFYGISRPEKSVITYKAAVEELYPGEAEKSGLPAMLIRKGTYVSISIPDFMKDVQRIGIAFRQLLQHPHLDPDGFCVEWYFNKTDVKCMIRLVND